LGAVAGFELGEQVADVGARGCRADHESLDAVLVGEILTTFALDGYLFDALREGAVGFFVKDSL